MDATGCLRRQLPSERWSTQQRLQFLQFAAAVDASQMNALDQAFRLTKIGTPRSRINQPPISIRNNYATAYPRLEEYLTSIGRQKLIKPLYEELVKDAGRQRAGAENLREGASPLSPDSANRGG